MINTWIPAIYNRTYEDVIDVQINSELEDAKGCWNAEDLNRIENNTAYCVEWMLTKKIITKAPSIDIRISMWNSHIVPEKLEIDRIISNVKLLIELSSNNPAIASELPVIYNATQINYVLANQIEYALELIHTQPRLPSDYRTVTLTHGIITKILREDGNEEIINKNTALVAEEETVYISGTPYGDDANYQVFNYWTGAPEDLLLLDNSESESTIFVMPYRDIEFEADYKTNIPRKLIIMGGYISPNLDPTVISGPTEAEYNCGDEVMVIANIAEDRYKFDTWTSSSSSANSSDLSDILTSYTGNTYPAVIRFSMPDENLRLIANYVLATDHYLTIGGGSGSGSYPEGTEICISADVPEGYTFSHWSGDISFLTDIYSSFQTIKMPNYSISLYACYEEEKTSCDVTMVDGLILVNGEEVSEVESLPTGNVYTLIPMPPEGYGISNWIVTGDTESPGTVTSSKYRAGKGTVTITGVYKPIRTLTVLCNGDSTSSIETYRQTQGFYWIVKALPAATEDRMFYHWEEQGGAVPIIISTSETLELKAISEDKTIVAIYGPHITTYRTITVYNKDNEKKYDKDMYEVGSSVEITTKEETDTHILDAAYVNGVKVDSLYRKSVHT